MALDFLKFKLSSDSYFEKLGTRELILGGVSKLQLPANSKNLKYFSCAELSTQDGNALRKARQDFEFVCVRGANPAICAWAANQKVDLLLQPFSSEANYIDSQSANVLLQNNVFVGVLFSEFLNSAGSRRSLLVKNASQCLKVLRNAGVKILFFSGAKNESELRAPEDLSSFAVLLGFERSEALACVRENAKSFLERSK